MENDNLVDVCIKESKLERITLEPDDDYTKFEKDLEILINKHSLENKSNTPDFILARHLVNCLRVFNASTNDRLDFYS